MAEKCNCPENCPAHSGIVVSIENTEDFIGEIKTNHLPHIYDALDSNKNWLIGILVSIVFLLAGVIMSIIVPLLKK